jgi:hypothetical protein
VIDLPPGDHAFWLTYHEAGGGAAAELYAAEGSHTEFDSNDVYNLLGHQSVGTVPVPGFCSQVLVTATEPGAWSKGQILNRKDAQDALAEGDALWTNFYGYYDFVNHSDPDDGVADPDDAGFLKGDLVFANDRAGDDNDFAVEVTGQLDIPVGSTYQFGFNSDDGGSLQIHGQTWTSIVTDATGNAVIVGDQLINDSLTGWSFTAGEIYLSPGCYEFTALMFERGGGSFFELFGRGVSATGRPDPAWHLLTTGGAGTRLDANGLELVAGSAGLLAHWACEEGGGTVAHDQSGNGHDATVQGAATWEPSLSGLGLAIAFDGVDDSADCGNPDALNFGAGDWSVCAWIKTTQSGTGDENKGTIFANGGDWTGGKRYALAVNEVADGLVTLTTDDDATKVQATGTTPVNDNEWHHVAGIRDGDALRLYVDGQPDGAEVLPAGYDLSGTSQHNAYIGVITDNRDGSLAKHFNGLIDEVRIYNGALSADQIAGLATTPDCFPACHPDYDDWVDVGKPDCWCNPLQCHGDADGELGGSPKTGQYSVGPADLNVLISGWGVKQPPHGPGIETVLNGICADFAHDLGGSAKTGCYRVGPTDLNILIANWLKKEPPFDRGLVADCLDCPGLLALGGGLTQCDAECPPPAWHAPFNQEPFVVCHQCDPCTKAPRPTGTKPCECTMFRAVRGEVPPTWEHIAKQNEKYYYDQSVPRSDHHWRCWCSN